MLDRYAAEHDVRTSTLDQYRWSLNGFYRWCREAGVPEEFADVSVNQYLMHLRDAGRSPHYIAQRRNNLLVLWRWLYEIGETDRPPGRVRVIRKPELPRDTWTPEEIARLLAHAESLPGRFCRTQIPRAGFWLTWISVAWDTALRPCDQRLLKWSQIRETLQITQQKTGGRLMTRLSERSLIRLALWQRDTEGTDLVWPKAITATRRRSAEWARLLTGTGLRGPLKQLRRSSATQVEQQSPGTGWVHLGHTSPTVAVRHYLGAGAYTNRPLPLLPGE